MNKYRTTNWSDRIEKNEVARETAATVVWVDRWKDQKVERTERKETANHRWFDTWADAHTWLVNQAEREVAAARRSLERANGRLGNVKGMKEPTEAL